MSASQCYTPIPKKPLKALIEELKPIYAAKKGITEAYAKEELEGMGEDRVISTYNKLVVRKEKKEE
jgi:hypothetical protein